MLKSFQTQIDFIDYEVEYDYDTETRELQIIKVFSGDNIIEALDQRIVDKLIEKSDENLNQRYD